MGKLLNRVKIADQKKERRFVAKDMFVVDTTNKARVKISYLGERFVNEMLGIIEEHPPEANLCCYELTRASLDDPIIAELGGEKKAEVKLSQVFSLMEKQPNGEEGILLDNGSANIFYVCNISGVLRVVNVDWYGGGWSVVANSVEYPYRWIAGFQVFSCNSL